MRRRRCCSARSSPGPPAPQLLGLLLRPLLLLLLLGGLELIQRQQDEPAVAVGLVGHPHQGHRQPHPEQRLFGGKVGDPIAVGGGREDHRGGAIGRLALEPPPHGLEKIRHFELRAYLCGVTRSDSSCCLVTSLPCTCRSAAMAACTPWMICCGALLRVAAASTPVAGFGLWQIKSNSVSAPVFSARRSATTAGTRRTVTSRGRWGSVSSGSRSAPRWRQGCPFPENRCNWSVQRYARDLLLLRAASSLREY